jgi:hypothetical protein
MKISHIVWEIMDVYLMTYSLENQLLSFLLLKCRSMFTMESTMDLRWCSTKGHLVSHRWAAYYTYVKNQNGVISHSYSHLIIKCLRSILFFILSLLHLLTCVYIIWVISSPTPLHPPTPLLFTPFQVEPVPTSCSPILLKRKHKR